MASLIRTFLSFCRVNVGSRRRRVLLASWCRVATYPHALILYCCRYCLSSPESRPVEPLHGFLRSARVITGMVLRSATVLRPRDCGHVRAADTYPNWLGYHRGTRLSPAAAHRCYLLRVGLSALTACCKPSIARSRCATHRRASEQRCGAHDSSPAAVFLHASNESCTARVASAAICRFWPLAAERH